MTTTEADRAADAPAEEILTYWPKERRRARMRADLVRRFWTPESIVTFLVVGACVVFVFKELQPSQLFENTTPGRRRHGCPRVAARLREAQPAAPPAPDRLDARLVRRFPGPDLLLPAADRRHRPAVVHPPLQHRLQAGDGPGPDHPAGRGLGLRPAGPLPFPGPACLAAATLPFLFSTANSPSTAATSPRPWRASSASPSPSRSRWCSSAWWSAACDNGQAPGSRRPSCSPAAALSHILPAASLPSAAPRRPDLAHDAGRDDRDWLAACAFGLPGPDGPVGRRARRLLGPAVLLAAALRHQHGLREDHRSTPRNLSHKVAVADRAGPRRLRGHVVRPAPTGRGSSLGIMADPVGRRSSVSPPQARLWNARVLPFWFLCLYLLAGVAFSEGGSSCSEPSSPVPSRRRAGPPGGAHRYRAGVWVSDLGALPAARSPVRAHRDRDRQVHLARVSGPPTVVHPGLGPLELPRVRVERQSREKEYFALVNTMAKLGQTDGCGRAMWEYEPELDQMGTPDALMLLPYWTNELHRVHGRAVLRVVGHHALPLPQRGRAVAPAVGPGPRPQLPSAPDMTEGSSTSSCSASSTSWP